MGDESSPPKSPENVLFGECPAEGGFEREEEFRLGDMYDPGLDKLVDFGAEHLLQDAITTDIERLCKVRGMGR